MCKHQYISVTTISVWVETMYLTLQQYILSAINQLSLSNNLSVSTFGGDKQQHRSLNHHSYLLQATMYLSASNNVIKSAPAKRIWVRSSSWSNNLSATSLLTRRKRNWEKWKCTDLRGDGEIQGGAKMLLNYRRERNFYIQQSSIHKPSTLPSFNMLSLDCYVLSLLFVTILTGTLYSAV